ncbi:MAG: hypothetical protein IKT41_04130 [Clostridia bacterium]|nr:hypothetical protein [Clostridia bacterium]
MRKSIENEIGSITLFVLVSMLFLTMFLATIYTLSTNNEAAARKATSQIKELYEVGLDDIDNVYDKVKEKNTITFTVTYTQDGSYVTVTCYAKKGMKWEEWVIDTEYNKIGLVLDGEAITTTNDGILMDSTDEFVYATDEIKNEEIYSDM